MKLFLFLLIWSKLNMFKESIKINLSCLRSRNRDFWCCIFNHKTNSLLFISPFRFRAQSFSIVFIVSGGWSNFDFLEVLEVRPGWQFCLLVNHSQLSLKGCEAVGGRAKTVNLSLLLPSEHMLRRYQSGIPSSSSSLAKITHRWTNQVREPSLWFEILESGLSVYFLWH